MDPDVALTRIRELAAKIITDDEGDSDVEPVDAVDLAQAVTDLDHWITSGGFGPADWRPEAPA